MRNNRSESLLNDAGGFEKRFFNNQREVYSYGITGEVAHALALINTISTEINPEIQANYDYLQKDPEAGSWEQKNNLKKAIEISNRILEEAISTSQSFNMHKDVTSMCNAMVGIVCASVSVSDHFIALEAAKDFVDNKTSLENICDDVCGNSRDTKTYEMITTAE